MRRRCLKRIAARWTTIGCVLAGLALAVTLMVTVMPASADPAPAESSGILPLPDYSGELFERSHLLGDFGGARTEWAGLPPLKWSSAMFRKTEEDHGKQATQTRRDCHEVTTG